jgi:hypothetical protein
VRSRRLWPTGLLALVAADCHSDVAADTWRAVREVYATPAAHRIDTHRKWSDGWGHALRFEAQDSSFVLVSPGSDGALGTEDDLDFSPAHLASRASNLSGCWTTTSMKYPDGEIRELHLTSQRIANAPDFRGTSNLPSSDVRWVPWGADSVVVFLLTGPQKSVIRVHVADSVLGGIRTVYGEGPIAGRTERNFEARRVSCQFRDEPDARF